jgi:hypothetical protein
MKGEYLRTCCGSGKFSVPVGGGDMVFGPVYGLLTESLTLTRKGVKNLQHLGEIMAEKFVGGKIDVSSEIDGTKF